MPGAQIVPCALRHASDQKVNKRRRPLPVLDAPSQIGVPCHASPQQRFSDLPVRQPTGVEKGVGDDLVVLTGVRPVGVGAVVAGKQFRRRPGAAKQVAGRIKARFDSLQVAKRSGDTQVVRQGALALKQRQHLVRAGVDQPQIDSRVHDRAGLEQHLRTPQPVVVLLVFGPRKIGVRCCLLQQNLRPLRLAQLQQVRIFDNQFTEALDIVRVDGLTSLAIGGLESASLHGRLLSQDPCPPA